MKRVLAVIAFFTALAAFWIYGGFPRDHSAYNDYASANLGEIPIYQARYMASYTDSETGETVQAAFVYDDMFRKPEELAESLIQLLLEEKGLNVPEDLSSMISLSYLETK